MCEGAVEVMPSRSSVSRGALSAPVEVNDDVGFVSGDLLEPQRGHSAPHPESLLHDMLNFGLAHLPGEMDNPGDKRQDSKELETRPHQVGSGLDGSQVLLKTTISRC